MLYFVRPLATPNLLLATSSFMGNVFGFLNVSSCGQFTRTIRLVGQITWFNTDFQSETSRDTKVSNHFYEWS